MIVLSERSLEAGVPQSVPDEVDVEAAVITVVLVKEPVGQAVSEDVRVDILWVTATELTALVVPERPYVGFASDPFDDIPNGASRHLVGLP